MHAAIQTLTKTLHHHPSALTRPWPGPPIHVLDAQVVYARRESHACSIRVIVYRVPCKSPRQTQHTQLGSADVTWLASATRRITFGLTGLEKLVA